MRRLLRTTVSSAFAIAIAIVAAPAASAISDTCLYDGPTKIVTVVFPGGANQNRTVSREPSGNKIYYNGSPCQTATVGNTKKIYVITGDGTQNLTIDLSSGPFAPGAGAESSGASEIEWEVDLGAGTDGITVQGGSHPETIGYVAKNGVKLNGDADTDVHLLNTERRYAYGGGGNDHLSASSTTPDVVFYGQNGNDTLIGGIGDDDLEGGGDADTIKGNDGGDGLYGGSGADSATGGDGGDTFYGGSGDDVFSGGSGSDTFYAESGPDGSDRFSGGPGLYDEMSYYQRSTKVVADLDGSADDGATGEHDRIGKDVEELEGGDGNDTLTGSHSDNYLAGNAGVDVLTGGDGDDNLSGGDGNDDLHGGAGDDGLSAGQQDDTVFGDAGNDTLYADNVADGNDNFHGGTGTDSIYYYNRSSTVWIRIGGTNEGGITESDTIHSDIENATGGSAGDIISGTNGDNNLYGNGGADTIDGGPGVDYINAGAGNDILTGGDGLDYVYGYDDDDTLHLNDGGTDYAYCGNGTDTASDHDVYDTTLQDCETT